METIQWPFGDADLQTPVYAATLAVTIDNRKTVLVPAILTGACTLNLTIASGLRVGAELILKVKATGSEVLTPGTGMQGPAIAGTAGKTKVVAYEFDGINFVATAAAVQID